jgi:hypothetical protein
VTVVVVVVGDSDVVVELEVEVTAGEPVGERVRRAPAATAVAPTRMMATRTKDLATAGLWEAPNPVNFEKETRSPSQFIGCEA